MAVNVSVCQNRAPMDERACVSTWACAIVCQPAPCVPEPASQCWVSADECGCVCVCLRGQVPAPPALPATTRETSGGAEPRAAEPEVAGWLRTHSQDTD